MLRQLLRSRLVPSTRVTLPIVRFSRHFLLHHHYCCRQRWASTASCLADSLIRGPPLQLGFGRIALQTQSSVVASSGSTIVLSTVAEDSSADGRGFLTVEYRQRHHAVGRIPSVRSRRDNTVLDRDEILASRAMDRALRPLLRPSTSHVHVQASVQACQPGESSPVAVALNASSAALYPYLTEPVAAVVLYVLENGSISMQRLDNVPSKGELLYAGTRDKVVMMEWTSDPNHGGLGLAEERWKGLLETAHLCIQPLLDRVEELQELKQAGTNESSTVFTLENDDRIGASLGLPPMPREAFNHQDSLAAVDVALIDGAAMYCHERLRESLQRIYGYQGDVPPRDDASGSVTVHRGPDLLSKATRGRREQMMQKHIARLIDQFLDERGLLSDTEVSASLYRLVADRLLREALAATAMDHGTRGDGRGAPGLGWQTVRPIQLQVPALPDSVHGSALFARGDTQVLCTVTLGAPRDGLPESSLFRHAQGSAGDQTQSPLRLTGSQTLPVGSLRFLRTQEAIVSDLNSKKVQADKERTGDSGSLAEFKRAYLQYDFPAYSTGNVSMGSVAHNRRSIGHGALAEKAILPVLPPAHEFPYAMRMTSEVTDSNGSSSMASVCGVYLALLDAGVPVRSPVAGVSVGLARKNDTAYRLLLDITGTEDYYGSMDFKIAGTKEGVTALQLDVKSPLAHAAILQALELAKQGRCAVIDEMQAQSGPIISKLLPRPELKESAPRVEVVRFDPQRKRDLIGPSGVILRQMEDRYGVDLDLTQEGQCLIFGLNRDMVKKAKATVLDLVADVEEGQVYTGTVIEVKDFGAIVELLRNKEGLLHASELADDEDARSHPEGLSGFVRQFLRVGQEIEVLCTGVDPVQGSIRLSRKALLNTSRQSSF